MRAPRLLLPLFVAAVGGCSQPARPVDPITVGPGESALPTDHPPLGAPPPPSAGAQRLTVQQLRLTYPKLLGADAKGQPITWRLGDNSLGLDRMARAMGEPDFIAATEEVLEPSPLYAKFVDDAARSVCDQTLKADAGRAARVLTRHVALTDTLGTNPKGVRDNLRYLKLRLHGVKLLPTDDAAVAGLATLFEKASQGASPTEGWRAVCVALLTAPEFHTY